MNNDKKTAHLQKVKLSVDIAESFMAKHDYDGAIAQWYKIKHELNFNSLNIDFRLFDAFLRKNDLVNAERILETVRNSNLVKNKVFFTKFAERRQILTSAKAKRCNIEFINLNDSNVPVNLISPQILKNIKSSDLTDFKLVFSIDNPYFCQEFKIEYYENIYRNSTKIVDIRVEPVIDIDNSVKYTFPVNLLNLKQIGVIIDTQTEVMWLNSIKLHGLLGVIRGKNSWLFLDNDTNHSVAQFCGKELISKEELYKWENYLTCLSKINNSILVIPPSKEMVFSEFYPFLRGSLCPIDQLIDLIKHRNCNYFYPIELLSKDRTSYFKTDTHWSSKAAMDVFFKILDMLKVDYTNFKHNFSFEFQKRMGDLGSKLNPIEYSETLVLTNKFNLDKYITFSNFCNSKQGHIVRFENNEAFIDKKLVIFGDSFSESMVPFLVSFFKTVIKIRSNASLMLDVIESLNFDYVIAEIAERFIIKCPVILKDLTEYAPIMRSDLSTLDRDYITKYTSSTHNDLFDRYMRKYKEFINNNS